MRADLRIVDYAPALADAFLRLNQEWLEKYFYVEEVDRIVLSNPQTEIIARGGHILFASVANETVGTVALRSSGAGGYELTKMAVTAASQGAGIGRALMLAAIERFHAVGGKFLFLETHSSLVTAISLYESAGFVHETPPRPSEYARADTYMVYKPRKKSLKDK